MKITKFLIIILVSVQGLFGQENYFTNAPSGLNVRESSSINSKRIDKLPYGALVKIIEETTITYTVTEGNSTTLSVWVKIKYNNFPYIHQNEDTYEWDKTGYVVKHYLQKLNKAHITVEEIDRTSFNQLYKEPIPFEPIKFTNFENVKTTLSRSVQWGYGEFFEDEGAIEKIILPSGQVLKLDKDAIDFGFVAYYPSEEIMVFEGGHSSDFSISLRTGESLETVGNPEYIIHSPSGKYRLNGWFPGQECSSYFIQEKTGDYYTYLTGFEYGDDSFARNLCYFKKFAWVDDGTFIYSYPFYEEGKDDERYFIGKINTH